MDIQKWLVKTLEKTWLWIKETSSNLWAKFRDAVLDFLTIDILKVRLKHFKSSSMIFIKSLRWTRLDAYIFKRFLLSLFGSLLLFIMIYELVQIFQEIRSLPKDVDAWLLAQRYIFESFYWILILQPFSFLFATTVVLSSLARHKELTAMVSTGASMQRITIFLVFFSILYFLMTITFLADKVIYPAYQKSEILKKVIFNKMNNDQLDRLKDQKNFVIFGSDGLLYIGNYYNAISQEITKLSVIKYNQLETKTKQKNVEPLMDKDLWISTNVEKLLKARDLTQDYLIDVNLWIDAEKAIWDKKQNTWIFMNGTIRTVEKNGEFFKVQKYLNKTFDFVNDPPEYFENVWYGVDAMSSREARAYIKRLKKAGKDFKDAEGKYFSKYSYPFGIIMIVLAGIGIINISSRKTSVVINFFLSLIVFMVYYLIFAIGLAMASKGSVSTFFGAFSGTLLLSIVSIILYSRTKT